LLSKRITILRILPWRTCVIILLAVGLLAGLPRFWSRLESGPETNGLKPVKAIVLTTQIETLALEYLGTVNAAELTRYSFRMPGRIDKIPVIMGQAMVRG